jgi:prophage maintenance system killer protein
MAALQYLTVQDILWINHQIAKKVNTFDYAKLEEATFYQYAYGESKDVPSQAERFLRGFLQLEPIAAFNQATGIIGMISFLEVNGYSFDLEDSAGAAWVRSFLTKSDDFANRVHHADHGDHGHKPSVRITIESVLRAIPLTIAGLVPTVTEGPRYAADPYGYPATAGDVQPA